MYAKEPPATPGVVVSLLIFGGPYGQTFHIRGMTDWKCESIANYTLG